MQSLGPQPMLEILAGAAAAETVVQRGLRERLPQQNGYAPLLATVGAMAQRPVLRQLPPDVREALGMLDQGIRMPEEALVASLDDALKAGETLGYPLVLKAVCTGLVHKSEAGLVKLGVTDASSLRERWSELDRSAQDPAVRDRVSGRIAQQQLRGGVEIFVGTRWAPAPLSLLPGTRSWMPSSSRSRKTPMRAAASRRSATANSSARANPTAPATFSVPERRPASWPPPKSIGRIGTPPRT